MAVIFFSVPIADQQARSRRRNVEQKSGIMMRLRLAYIYAALHEQSAANVLTPTIECESRLAGECCRKSRIEFRIKQRILYDHIWDTDMCVNAQNNMIITAIGGVQSARVLNGTCRSLCAVLRQLHLCTTPALRRARVRPAHHHHHHHCAESRPNQVEIKCLQTLDRMRLLDVFLAG